MIDAVSAARNGLYTAITQFNRAAQQVVTSGEGNDSDVAGSTDGSLIDGMTGMLTARAAFSASLQAMRASNEMLSSVLDLGGYGPPSTEGG